MAEVSADYEDEVAETIKELEVCACECISRPVYTGAGRRTVTTMHVDLEICADCASKDKPRESVQRQPSAPSHTPPPQILVVHESNVCECVTLFSRMW